MAVPVIVIWRAIAKVPQKLKQFADIVYWSFTTETTEIWNIHRIHLVILEQYVYSGLVGLNDILGSIGPPSPCLAHHCVQPFWLFLSPIYCLVRYSHAVKYNEMHKIIFNSVVAWFNMLYFLAKNAFSHSSPAIWNTPPFLSPHHLTYNLLFSNLLLKPNISNWLIVPNVVSQCLRIWSLGNIAHRKYVYWSTDWHPLTTPATATLQIWYIVIVE